MSDETFPDEGQTLAEEYERYVIQVNTDESVSVIDTEAETAVFRYTGPQRLLRASVRAEALNTGRTLHRAMGAVLSTSGNAERARQAVKRLDAEVDEQNPQRRRAALAEQLASVNEIADRALRLVLADTEILRRANSLRERLETALGATESPERASEVGRVTQTETARSMTYPDGRVSIEFDTNGLSKPGPY